MAGGGTDPTHHPCPKDSAGHVAFQGGGTVPLLQRARCGRGSRAGDAVCFILHLSPRYVTRSQSLAFLGLGFSTCYMEIINLLLRVVRMVRIQ